MEKNWNLQVKVAGQNEDAIKSFIEDIEATYLLVITSRIIGGDSSFHVFLNLNPQLKKVEAQKDD